MEHRIRNIMAKVFEIPEVQIKEDASAHSIPTWDSLRHLDLVLALESEFRIKIEDEEIPTLINYPIIVSTIKAHLE